MLLLVCGAEEIGGGIEVLEIPTDTRWRGALYDVHCFWLLCVLFCVNAGERRWGEGWAYTRQQPRRLRLSGLRATVSFLVRDAIFHPNSKFNFVQVE